jgi:L-lactate oxidase
LKKAKNERRGDDGSSRPGWSDIEFCRQESGLPVIIKSILSPTQALQALRYGCSAVWLSNHGGRQLDNSPSAITTLPHVAVALKGRVPIIVDGGIYRGQDVFRALALGASVVALGRPTLYGSALGGTQGVQAVHTHLKNEFTMVMRLAGTPRWRASPGNSSPALKAHQHKANWERFPFPP